MHGTNFVTRQQHYCLKGPNSISVKNHRVQIVPDDVQCHVTCFQRQAWNGKYYWFQIQGELRRAKLCACWIERKKIARKSSLPFRLRVKPSLG